MYSSGFGFSAMTRDRRQRHAGEVIKFLKDVHEKLDTSLSATGIDGEAFYKVLTSLVEKWYGDYAPIRDSDGTRLMNQILSKEIQNPLFMAIVVDKLDLFISRFVQSSIDNPLRWLEVACICGAPKITAFLLGTIDKVIWSRSPAIVAYALSSGNAVFARDIALIMKVISGSVPSFLHIYGQGQGVLLDEIAALFTSSTLSQNGLKT